MHDVVRDLLHVGHFKEYFSSLVITNSQVLSRMTEGVYYFKMCCFFFLPGIASNMNHFCRLRRSKMNL